MLVGSGRCFLSLLITKPSSFSLQPYCGHSATGKGQVWPGLSCPALVPLIPNELGTSPQSPGKKCFSHTNPSTPAQGHGGKHAACSAPCYQNGCQPASVNTGQSGNADISEVILEERDQSKETTSLHAFVEDDRLLPELSVFAKPLHSLVLMLLFLAAGEADPCRDACLVL